MLNLLFIILLLLLITNSLCIRYKSTLVMNSDISLVRSIKSLNSRLADESLLKDASTELKISSPWNAPKYIWSWSWRFHQFMIPILHMFDKATPKDSFINLPVLWWKAIAGCRLFSKLNDGGVAFDLLPPISRYVVAFPLCYLYPKLHHQNVALRTVYLDNAINSELENEEDVNVIVMGAGYDTRALRFLQNNNHNHSWFEIDFPNVMRSKSLMLQRFLQRRNNNNKLPVLLEADLNDLDLVKSQLSSIKNSKRKTIFVFEAVLMYMNQEKVKPLLNLCLNEAKQSGSKSVSICFADRFPNVRLDNNDEEKNDVIEFFKELGGSMKEWRPKPGRARHMGVATFNSDN